MRVGLVIYGSLDQASGGFLYDRRLKAALQAAGHQVEVFAQPWQSYARCLLHNFDRKLARRLSASRMDLLLQDELNHPSLWLLNRRLRRLGRPLVGIVHHLRSSEDWSPGRRTLYRAVERRYLASLDAFVFNSRATRQAVAELLGRPAPGMVAHPGGDRLGPPLPPALIGRRALEPGPLRLLFVGHLIPRKGPLPLLEALAPLAAVAWCLEVVGSRQVDRAHATAVRRSIEGLGLQDRVRLHGAIDDAALRRLLARSHLMTMPFSFEGFGIAFLEGLAFGLPALASQEGGAGEMLRHGREGFLVAPGDRAAVTDLVGRLAADRAELARLALAARRRFSDFPTWQQTMAAVTAYLVRLSQGGEA